MELYKEMDKVEEEVAKAGLRLGQFFCHQYLKDAWPDLYFADGKKARALIAEWMQRHQYHSMWQIPPSQPCI